MAMYPCLFGGGSGPTPTPTLITKNITQNGTYHAQDDNADGYSEVNVSVSGGGGNFPVSTSTLILTNESANSTLNFTDDYHNYSILKIIAQNASSGKLITFYTTPSTIDALCANSNNLVNFNEFNNNQYVAYRKTSNIEWTRYGYRNLFVKYIYGLEFTNCTATETVLYNRGSYSSSEVTFTPPVGASFLEYDYILFSLCTSSQDESQPAYNIFMKSKNDGYFGEESHLTQSVFDLNKYNGMKTITMTADTITAYQYCYVVGITLNFT